MLKEIKLVLTCANSLSLVFLLLMDMKKAAGNIRQIVTPTVEPSKPSTYSMFGIKIPIIIDTITIAKVRHLNLISGM